MAPRFTAAVIVLASLLAASAAKAQDDPADLGLWQLVLAHNTPADYQIYLQAFPNGKFAALARIRAQNAATPPAPEPQADPDAPHFTVEPTSARVGQRFTVNCGTIPSGGRFDTIVAAPAGSPPNVQIQGPQHVQMDYVANCQGSNSDGTLTLGPLPPGRWEFRWMTTLYNLENRMEVKAKVDVVVR